MGHAIPVVASSSNPTQPVDDLIAEIFWVTVDGELVQQLDRVPVQNGAAVYNGPARPEGLFWAIRIQQAVPPGAVFRSGPLRRLPGRHLPMRLVSEVSFLVSRVGLSLTQAGSDGQPYLVAKHLQNLPFPLEFVDVGLDGDRDGNYVVTVRGRLVKPEPISSRLFAYRRAFRLVGNLHPGRTQLPVLAEPVGRATIRGANVRPYAAVLGRMTKDAVETQLDAAARWMALAEAIRTGSSVRPETVSVSELNVTPRFPGADADMTVSGGTIMGVQVGPGPVVPDQV